MNFTHPLARAAQVWPSMASTGQAQNLLVIVTTLELNPDSKRYKKDKVDRLSEAAVEWLSFHQDKAEGYILINRLRDWQAD